MQTRGQPVRNFTSPKITQKHCGGSHCFLNGISVGIRALSWVPRISKLVGRGNRKFSVFVNQRVRVSRANASVRVLNPPLVRPPADFVRYFLILLLGGSSIGSHTITKAHPSSSSLLLHAEAAPVVRQKFRFQFSHTIFQINLHSARKVQHCLVPPCTENHNKGSQLERSSVF